MHFLSLNLPNYGQSDHFAISHCSMTSRHDQTIFLPSSMTLFASDAPREMYTMFLSMTSSRIGVKSLHVHPDMPRAV